MKLSTENGIRSFLIRISKNCEDRQCEDCPFNIPLGNSKFSRCFWCINIPKEWNVNGIMERYKNIE